MSSPIDTIAENKRSLINTRIALLIIVIIFVADLIGSYGMYEENQQLKQDNKYLLEDLDTYKSSSVYWKEKCEHYQSANEALIKHAEPKSLNKAVKATPLPKLIEV